MCPRFHDGLLPSRSALALLSAISPLALAQPTPAPQPPSTPAPKAEPNPTPQGVAKIQLDAKALEPLVKSELAKRFLAAAFALPPIEPRTLHRDAEGRWFTQQQAEALPADQRASLKPVPMDETRYYNTKYGSPLAYARALDLAATCAAKPPFASLEGARILDFGYGTVGHLRLMASNGAHATGVDVDPFLPTLYSAPSDAGAIPGHDGAPAGTVTLVSGRFPADDSAKAVIAAAAGAEGFDLITSKNTLKNGYINPERDVDPRMLVDLGVPHEQFVTALFDSLKPGGLVVIYNLSPAPSKDAEPYKPWADGRCPFPREMWEKAGFNVLAFDENDDAAARDLGRALGWDKGGMDLQTDLFGHYTIAQRPLK